MRFKHTLILFSISLSCATGNSTRHDTTEPIIIESVNPKIFNTPDDEILFEIRQMCFSDTSTYEIFTRRSILLNLYCDTNTCTIDSILVEGNDRLPNYSKRIINYFMKMSPINCYDEFYKKKFSQYDVLLADWGGGLFLTIGHGYRPY
ncbi:MAG: hypothetical protein HRU26_03395 [Psychroserpens sp.]|nr:hypothetical protein [Psychroserpens sp.]